MRNRTTNAQFFSVDMIFAVIIFILIINAIYSYWDYAQGKIPQADEIRDIEIISRNAINALIMTEGMPSNWSKLNVSDFNEGNVSSLGLARSTSINNYDTNNKQKIGAWNTGALNLDLEKISQLAEFNISKYETIKNILGIIGHNYEFELRLYKWNGTGYALNTTIGKPIEANSTNIVNLHRYALLNSTWAYINFKGWEKCTQSPC